MPQHTEANCPYKKASTQNALNASIYRSKLPLQKKTPKNVLNLELGSGTVTGRQPRTFHFIIGKAGLHGAKWVLKKRLGSDHCTGRDSSGISFVVFLNA